MLAFSGAGLDIPSSSGFARGLGPLNWANPTCGRNPVLQVSSKPSASRGKVELGLTGDCRRTVMSGVTPLLHRCFQHSSQLLTPTILNIAATQKKRKISDLTVDDLLPSSRSSSTSKTRISSGVLSMNSGSYVKSFKLLRCVFI